MKETISAMMDGELDEPGASKALAALMSDQDLNQTWGEYHLIGDALRVNTALGVDVRKRVAERVAAEPTVLAPRAWRKPHKTRVIGAVALAASVSFAAVIGWNQLAPRHSGTSLVADKGVPVQSAQSRPMSALDDSYLLAHQEMMAEQGAVRVAYGRGGVRR